MEDILASIRRILSEDEANPEPASEAPASTAAKPPGQSRRGSPPGSPPGSPLASAAPPIPAPPPDVLALDRSMLVEEPSQADETPSGNFETEPDSLPPLQIEPAPMPPAAPPEDRTQMASTPEPHQPASYSPPEQLVAPEAAAAAASSVGSLLRTIGNRQNVGVSRGGPTIEDLVRDELRPVLKAWLDVHLPALVERLVRAEIERVVGRADS